MLKTLIVSLIRMIFKTRTVTVPTADSGAIVTESIEETSGLVLSLIRTSAGSDGVFGTLDKVIGENIGVTLEHSYNGKPKLPVGTYKCVRGMHQLHDGVPFETFEITNVPGHTGILFHVGNYNEDSEGCVLLGRRIATQENGKRMITSSKNTFNKFMDITRGLNEFTLKVI